VVVRFPESARADVAELERLLVPAPGGERVPLGQLATFTLVEAPAQVSRENGMRRVVAEVNVRGRDLGGFVDEVRRSGSRRWPPNCRRATASSTGASSRTSSARCAS
jgi:cobalt-zinc-cadmium resistance protein CzcA